MFDADRLDHVAHHGDFDRLVLAVAHDRQAQLGAWLATHLLYRLIERHALHRLFVEPDDQITRTHARPLRRCVVDRGDDLDEPILHANLDAQAAELAAGADADIAVVLFVEIRGMRIQAAEHALNGILEELSVVDRLDIVLLDASEHFGKYAQLFQRQTIGRLRRFGHRRSFIGHHAGDNQENRGQGRRQTLLHIILESPPRQCGRGINPPCCQ